MLPILDISEYLQNPDGDASHQFVELLRETCHGPGFFYLVGHGIDQQVSDNTLAVANQFFNLPAAERESLAIARSAGFRGYTLLNTEKTNGLPDWRDQIDIGPEEPEPQYSRNTVRMIRHGFAYAVRTSGPPVFPRCPAQSEPGWIMYSRLVWH